jgi:hypothetical protein
MNLESSHFYTTDGLPCHTQPTKKGAKNKTRPTNVSDARKLGLLPSVSGITKMLDNPALRRYVAMETVKACYDCTPVGAETLEEYTAHIMDKAGKDAGQAADLGSVIHRALELRLTNDDAYAPDATIRMPDGGVRMAWEFVNPAIAALEKADIEVIESEKVLVNLDHGYAGTTDIKGFREEIPIIADFKTTRTKPGKPIEPRESHQMQLPAYWRAAYGDGPMLGCNIYISTTEVGRVETHWWTEREMEEGWQAFLNCLALWKWVNKYDPALQNIPA